MFLRRLLSTVKKRPIIGPYDIENEKWCQVQPKKGSQTVIPGTDTGTDTGTDMQVLLKSGESWDKYKN